MFERFPQTSNEMRNPFIVLRFVLFAILIYVNILIFGFAAWNLTVLKSLGLDVLGAPTFVIFNACLLECILLTCLAAPWFTRMSFDKVRHECVWTGVVSAMQLAGSIDVTVNGPPVLCQGTSVTACASSTLLVALSWISCMMLLLYAFSLLTTAITHMSSVPDLWTSSIRAVPWFTQPPVTEEVLPTYNEKARRFEELIKASRASFHYSTPIFEQHAKALPPSPLEPPRFPSTPTSPIWQIRKQSVESLESAPRVDERRTTWTSRAMSGALSHKISCESMRPGWAKRSSARRGVDLPFTMPRFSFKPPPPVRPLRPLKLKSRWSQSTTSPRAAPSLPAKARLASAAPGPLDTSLSPTSTFYIDLERDAVVAVDPVTRPVSYDMFPQDVMDPDLPVTRSQRTEWIRAASSTSSLSR